MRCCVFSTNSCLFGSKKTQQRKPDPHLLLFAATLLCSSSLFAGEFTFVDNKHPVHLDTDFRYVGNADFHSSGSHLSFADSYDTLYLSYYIDQKNSLSLGLGYQFLKFDWDKNPRFRGDHYHYANLSLTWISFSLDRWRWVITNGVTVDAKDVDFGDTGVFYTFWWGRYTILKEVGGHIGVIAYAGIRNAYAIPVIGFDWQIARVWRLHAIFPLDISLRMYVRPHLFFSLMYATFGDYRYPRRVHDGIGRFEKGIFDVYSNGAELNLNYVLPAPTQLEAGIGGGWNFGGWVRIKDRHNHNAKYFKYKGAPYGHAYLAFNF